MNPRAFAFISVGTVGLLRADVVVLPRSLSAAHWSAASATALAVETAILTNFFWHERWTWRDRADVQNASLRSALPLSCRRTAQRLSSATSS